MTELEKPFTIGGNECNVSGSIGISLYPEHGENSVLLLRSADAAMYRAKERRNCYQFPAPESS